MATYSVGVTAADLRTVVGGLAERRVVARAVAAGAVLATGAVGVREGGRHVDRVRRDQADVDARVAVVECSFDWKHSTLACVAASARRRSRLPVRQFSPSLPHPPLWRNMIQPVMSPLVE